MAIHSVTSSMADKAMKIHAMAVELMGIQSILSIAIESTADNGMAIGSMMQWKFTRWQSG